MSEITFDQNPTSEKPKKNNVKNKLVAGIIILTIGMVSLIAGVVFLVMTLTSEPKAQDAEYLVAVGSWQREDVPETVWTFTEIGKGSLTTDAHANDYDFAWAMEGDTLKIETEWLYTINDDFEYKIEGDKLILNDVRLFVSAN